MGTLNVSELVHQLPVTYTTIVIKFWAYWRTKIHYRDRMWTCALKRESNLVSFKCMVQSLL